MASYTIWGFCVWLLLFSKFSRLIYAAARIRPSFLFTGQIFHWRDVPYFGHLLVSRGTSMFPVLSYEYCRHEYSSLCANMLSVPLGTYLGAEPLGHMVIPHLTFWRNAKTSLKQLHCFTFLLAMYYVPTSPQPHQHRCSSLYFSHSRELKWYLTMKPRSLLLISALYLLHCLHNSDLFQLPNTLVPVLFATCLLVLWFLPASLTRLRTQYWTVAGSHMVKGRWDSLGQSENMEVTDTQEPKILRCWRGEKKGLRRDLLR